VPYESCKLSRSLVFWNRLSALCKICYYMFHHDPQHHSQTALVKYNQLNMCNSCHHFTDDVHIGSTVLKIWRCLTYLAIALCFYITIARQLPRYVNQTTSTLRPPRVIGSSWHLSTVDLHNLRSCGTDSTFPASVSKLLSSKNLVLTMIMIKIYTLRAQAL